MSERRIVVVGGGYAGVTAAKVLERRLRPEIRRGQVSVTLVDRYPYHTLMTELHEVAGQRVDPEAVKVSFARIFAGSKVQVRITEVTGVDFPTRKLLTRAGEIPYDYLLLCTGGRPEFFGIEGVQQHSFTLWSLEDAIRIRSHVELMFREAAREPNPERRRFLLSFVIAGAGFTGVELVGELVELADLLCRRYHIDRDEVRIRLVEAMDRILPIIAEKPRLAAERFLKRNGVEILTNSPIVKAEEGAYILNDLTRVEGATLVWTCGVQASEFTARIALTKGKVSNDTCSIVTPEGIHGMAACYFEEDEKEIVGQRGRILVNESMQSVDYPEVYLAGDVIWYVYQERVVPQIVENALQSAATAAANIEADIRGRPKRLYRPVFHGFMVSIGSRFAVASVMGRNLVGWPAMALKHLVNFHYLWEIAGFNAIWAYFLDHFVDVKERRTLTAGHLSARISTLLLLPARLWLGAVWLIEGLNKVAEGWLTFDRSRLGFLFSTAQVGGAEATAGATAWAADTATQATAAVTQAGEAAQKLLDLNAPILAPDSWPVMLFRTVVLDGILAHLPFALVQAGLVLAEVGIGLALLGGLFTAPAALASIGFCAMFVLSGMFSWSQLGLVAVAVALLGGGGRSLGLDHWVLPWLGDRWASWGPVQRLHAYLGEPNLRRRLKRRRDA